MIFKPLTPQEHHKLMSLWQEAFDKNMTVDFETMSLIPLNPPRRPWPVGDRTPEDYEGGKDE